MHDFVSRQESHQKAESHGQSWQKAFFHRHMSSKRLRSVLEEAKYDRQFWQESKISRLAYTQ